MCFEKCSEKGIYQFLGLLLCTIAAHAQLEPESKPYPPDAFLKGILDFEEPTGLRGRILYIDRTKQIIWIEWAQLLMDRPSCEKGWMLVPGEWTIAVQPLNQAQFYDLQQMVKGTILDLVIQLDQEGLRGILSFHELALLPKVYTTFSVSGIVPED